MRSSRWSPGPLRAGGLRQLPVLGQGLRRARPIAGMPRRVADSVPRGLPAIGRAAPRFERCRRPVFDAIGVRPLDRSSGRATRGPTTAAVAAPSAFHALFVAPREFRKVGFDPFAMAGALRRDWGPGDQDGAAAVGGLGRYDRALRRRPSRSQYPPKSFRAIARLRKGRRVAVEAAGPIDGLAALGLGGPARPGAPRAVGRDVGVRQRQPLRPAGGAEVGGLWIWTIPMRPPMSSARSADADRLRIGRAPLGGPGRWPPGCWPRSRSSRA